jgi:hypothetical protein
VLSLVVALAVGIGGVLPRITAYRCAIMGAVVSHTCCPQHEAPAERTIAESCCAPLEGPAAVVRIAPGRVGPEFGPAPLVGAVAWASPSFVSASLGLVRVIDAAPPPTRSVFQLGTVLRI